MNENLNLVEILKDCPKGTKLYSTIYGDVELVKVYLKDDEYPIEIEIGEGGDITYVANDGRQSRDFPGECILFPSKEQRDWTKFSFKKPKFDPMTFKPYDKVLVRDGNSDNWKNQFFSYIIESVTCHPCFCINNVYTYCIPYNDDTKHIVGTSEEAPEFYRYWED